MKAKFVIPGTLPGLNEYIAANRRSKYEGAAVKNKAEHVIALAIRSQLHGMRFAQPVVIRYLWVEPNRRRDKDNIAFAKKFIQDALVRSGMLQNDGWKQIAGFEDAFKVDSKRPRVEVEIEEEDEI